MEALKWKIKIAVLWLIAAEAYSAHMIMVTIDPVSEKKMLEWGAGIPAEGWLFAAIYWLIPFWMAFVTIAVKGPSNRWANFVLGIIGTLLGIYHFFMCGVPLSFIPPGPVAGPTVHHILLLITAVVATALITWYAWKFGLWTTPSLSEGSVCTNTAKKSSRKTQTALLSGLAAFLTNYSAV